VLLEEKVEIVAFAVLEDCAEAFVFFLFNPISWREKVEG
jgi:hypothetical protein